ncbi:uncharacterized protein [Oryza sativa Japonica Group]|uniref:Expressed protein n=2 Tax=Oryza sativa subsp. japonica TaxID=39947 RepID=Q10N64_ORYSJ|nr:expressed protein [Oryza sativa Japonica Group]BAS83571.1 Os03g0281201 [Oryza sativa Japonica Group]
MCPRAAMARASAQCFGEEEYIDLDLSSCRGFEFRVCRSAAAPPPCGDEMLFRGSRLHKAKHQQEADAGGGGGGGGGCGGGRRSTATVAPWHAAAAVAGIRNAQPAARMQRQPDGGATGRRKKGAAGSVHAKLQASRAFFRSLFARTSCSDEQCHGVGVRATTRSSRAATAASGAAGSVKPAPFGQIRNSYGSCSGRGAAAAPTTLRSSIEQEKLMDEEEHAASVRQRKSFSGVIKWRPPPAPAAAAARPPPPPAFPTRRSSSAASDPPLKRCSSARSESEGLIQGAIAYCKRSQQQLVLARKSVSDAALCSLQFQIQL